MGQGRDPFGVGTRFHRSQRPERGRVEHPRLARQDHHQPRGGQPHRQDGIGEPQVGQWGGPPGPRKVQEAEAAGREGRGQAGAGGGQEGGGKEHLGGGEGAGVLAGAEVGDVAGLLSVGRSERDTREDTREGERVCVVP